MSDVSRQRLFRHARNHAVLRRALVAAIVIVGASPLSTAMAATPTFAAGENVATVGGTNRALAVDLNGDSLPDLVTYSSGDSSHSPSIQAFLGDGAGGFDESTNLPLSGDGQGLASTDFNGDGHPDLAVGVSHSGSTPSDLMVYLGDGQGGVGTPIRAGSGLQPVVADFNHDGVPDLAGLGLNGVNVILGDGHGGFAPATSTSTGPANMSSLASADFNGDGFAELVIEQAVIALPLCLESVRLEMSEVGHGDDLGWGNQDHQGAPGHVKEGRLPGFGNGQAQRSSQDGHDGNPCVVGQGPEDCHAQSHCCIEHRHLKEYLWTSKLERAPRSNVCRRSSRGWV